MEQLWIIPILVALIPALYYLFDIYKRRNDHATKDMDLANLLQKTETDFSNGMLKIEEMKKDGHSKKQLEKYADAITTTYLNSIDNMCTQYLDGKVDKERFKKIFFEYIRQVMENPNMKKFLDTATTKHRAIIKVYKKWYDLEK